MDLRSTNIWMYISSFNEEVTGSNTYVQVNWSDGREVKFVIDCGLFQEARWANLNSEKFAYKPASIDFAIATHFHTDHIGRFPYFVNEGFDGKIYTTHRSKTMFPKMLDLTAQIMEEQYKRDLCRWKKQKSDKSKQRGGHGKRDKINGKVKKKKYVEFVDRTLLAMKPQILFTKDDVAKAQAHVETKELMEAFSPAQDVYVTFYPNGHLVGSVVTVVTAVYGDEEFNLLITGDYAKQNKVTGELSYVPQEVLDKIDIVISESTYGASPEHRDIATDYDNHLKILRDTLLKGRKLIYMVNAIERPLSLVRELQYIMQHEDIGKKLAEQTIYFDSTFGIVGLKAYLKELGEETLNLPKNFQLITSENRDVIFAALMSKGPVILMTTSPQFYQGAFNLYADKVLPNPNANIAFVSYVPETVSNIIRLPRGSKMEYNHSTITKNCTMYKLGHFSSHASIEELAELIDGCKNKNTILFLHGQYAAKDHMVERFAENGVTTYAMLRGKTVRVNRNGITKVY